MERVGQSLVIHAMFSSVATKDQKVVTVVVVLKRIALKSCNA
jgi:hypothetical protein